MQDGRKGVFLVKENVICLFFDIFTHNPTLQEGMNPPLRQFISTNPATLSLSGTEALPFATLYPRVTRLAQGKTCLQSLKGSCKTISQKNTIIDKKNMRQLSCISGSSLFGSC